MNRCSSVIRVGAGALEVPETGTTESRLPRTAIEQPTLANNANLERRMSLPRAWSLDLFNIPKASPESAARSIFDGLEKSEQEVLPDPVSQTIAEGWPSGVNKALERQFAAFIPERAAEA